jgi:hypothetical protein
LRIFKTKWFARYAKRSGIDDNTLCEAIQRAERGLIDADLGAEMIKQRIARSGQSRARGYRSVIAFRSQHRAVFLYGFAKNEKENISDDELASLKDIAAGWLDMNNQDLKHALADGRLQLDFVHFLDPSSERCFIQLNKFLGRGKNTPSCEIYYAVFCLSREYGSKKCTKSSYKR